MATPTLEERVEALEAEIGHIRAQQSGHVNPGWKRIVGVFNDNPEFEEAVRFGREYRESLRPKEDEEEEEVSPGC